MSSESSKEYVHKYTGERAVIVDEEYQRGYFLVEMGNKRLKVSANWFHKDFYEVAEVKSDEQ